MTQALANVANINGSSTQSNTLSGTSQSSTFMPQYQKYYADEYKINGELYIIQAKKFMEDLTQSRVTVAMK